MAERIVSSVFCRNRFAFDLGSARYGLCTLRDRCSSCPLKNCYSGLNWPPLVLELEPDVLEPFAPVDVLIRLPACRFSGLRRLAGHLIVQNDKAA
jgi:hypothetical protein